jgi:hypothetical protein
MSARGRPGIRSPTICRNILKRGATPELVARTFNYGGPRS